MNLSYTALKTFQECHFRYHLRYDRGLARACRTKEELYNQL